VTIDEAHSEVAASLRAADVFATESQPFQIPRSATDQADITVASTTRSTSATEANWTLYGDRVLRHATDIS